MTKEVMAQRVIDTWQAMAALDAAIKEQKRQWKVEREILHNDLRALQDEMDSGQMRLDDVEGE